MASIYEQKNRVVFPRWRDFKSTAAAGDIQPFHKKPQYLFTNDDIPDKLNDWANEKTVGTAIDVLNSSFNLGLKDTSLEAADFILKNKSVIPNGLDRIINAVLNIEEKQEPKILSNKFDRNIINEHFHQQISNYRKRLINYPYNPIAWVELARFHAIMNNLKKAERALLTALNLAPENRYVLRSLSRFYVHNHQPEKALYYLKKSQIVKYDPWLLATHISVVNQDNGKASHLVKNGFQLMESNKFSNFDTNELSSSLATLELYSGATKNARKLFNNSLQNPNDNSVAQASWASHHLSGIQIQEKSLLLPCAFEARALEFYLQGKFQEAFDESVKWLLDEPFATRPARLSSHLAATYLNDYKISTELSRFALQISPDNFDLLNNLAFGLCLDDRPDEAEKVYAKINYAGLNNRAQIVYTATKGLIFYRKGELAKGKENYMQALKKSKEINEDGLHRLAMTNYLREEALTNPNAMIEIGPLLENLKESSKEIQITMEIEKIEKILSANRQLE